MSKHKNRGRQVSVQYKTNHKEDWDEINFDNYKGMHYDDENQKYQDPVTGAHFYHVDMCARLMNLQKSINYNNYSNKHEDDLNSLFKEDIEKKLFNKASNHLELVKTRNAIQQNTETIGLIKDIKTDNDFTKNKFIKGRSKSNFAYKPKHNLANIHKVIELQKESTRIRNKHRIIGGIHPFIYPMKKRVNKVCLNLTAKNAPLHTLKKKSIGDIVACYISKMDKLSVKQRLQQLICGNIANPIKLRNCGSRNNNHKVYRTTRSRNLCQPSFLMKAMNPHNY